MTDQKNHTINCL